MEEGENRQLRTELRMHLSTFIVESQGSFMEFLEVIKPLALPTSPNSPIFDVIVPSHPGYTFSSSPRVSPDPLNGKPRGEHSGKDGDMLVSDVARIMDKLMQALGYADGYAIQAGDWGSAVARSQSVQFPQRVKGESDPASDTVKA